MSTQTIVIELKVKLDNIKGHKVNADTIFSKWSQNSTESLRDISAVMKDDSIFDIAKILHLFRMNPNQGEWCHKYYFHVNCIWQNGHFA